MKRKKRRGNLASEGLMLVGKKVRIIAVTSLFLMFTVSCETIEIKSPPADLRISADIKPTYTWLRSNIFSKHCSYCHSGRPPFLLSYESIQTVVISKQPLQSRLYFMVATGRMPKGGTLGEVEKWAIYQWIKNGANND